MKKLLLVMLVPVLVLGLFSCGGKVMDGEAVLSAMQGEWTGRDGTSDTPPVPDTTGNIFVLTANQATVFKTSYADQEDGTVAFRINASGAIATEKNIVAGGVYSGTISFYGFDDKKKTELGKIDVTFTAADSNASPAVVSEIEVTKSEKAVHYQNLLIPPVGKYRQ